MKNSLIALSCTFVLCHSLEAQELSLRPKPLQSREAQWSTEKSPIDSAFAPESGAAYPSEEAQIEAETTSTELEVPVESEAPLGAEGATSVGSATPLPAPVETTVEKQTKVSSSSYDHLRSQVFLGLGVGVARDLRFLNSDFTINGSRYNGSVHFSRSRAFGANLDYVYQESAQHGFLLIAGFDYLASYYDRTKIETDVLKTNTPRHSRVELLTPNVAVGWTYSIFQAYAGIGLPLSIKTSGDLIGAEGRFATRYGLALRPLENVLLRAELKIYQIEIREVSSGGGPRTLSDAWMYTPMLSGAVGF